MGAWAILDRDAHGVAGLPHRRAVGEPAEPDLGTLQVGEDAHGVVGGVGGTAHALIGLFVVSMVAVAEVHPGDVHPRVDERTHLLVSPGSGAQCAYDLGASGHDEPA